MSDTDRPGDAVAWLSLPLPMHDLAALTTALQHAYGIGLLVRQSATGMWLVRSPVEDQAQAAVIRSAHEDWSDT